MATEQQRNFKQAQAGTTSAAQRMGTLAPYVNHRAPNGPPVMPEAPQLGNGVKPSTAMQYSYRPNFTMGGNADSAINAASKVVPDAAAPTDVRPKYNPANGSPEAKAWQAQRAAAAAGAAGNAAPPTPSAPAATAPQGAAYRAGAAAGRLANPVLKAAGAVATPAILAGTAGTVLSTPTSAYETRFGLGANEHEGVAGLVRDVGVRSLGAASDLGDALTLGLAGKYLYADKQQQAAANPAGAPSPVERLGQSNSLPANEAANSVAADLPNAQAGQITYDKETKTYSGVDVGPGAAIVNGRGGGAISAQNMQAANQLAADQRLSSIARVAGQMPGSGQQQPMINALRAPTVAHSGNDYTARKQLENLKTSASSIMNTERWGGKGASKNPAVLAYQQALQADLAAQGKQPDVDMQAMGLNAGLMRESMSQDGANQRAAMGERTAAQRLGLDTRRLAMDETTQGFQARQAQRIEGAQNDYLNAETDEARSSAYKRLMTLSGKEQQGKYKLHVTPHTKNVDGSTTLGSVFRLDERTGDVQQVDGGGAASNHSPTDESVKLLKANPKMAAQFDEFYGAGASKKYLN